MIATKILRPIARTLLPSKARRMLSDTAERVHAHRLLTDSSYRDAFIQREVEKFAPNRQWSHWRKDHELRVAAYWDNDGRFRWLKRPAEKHNIGLLHIPRSIYRPIFSQLFQRKGYRPDERNGEISLNVFYESRFAAGRKKYLAYCEAVAESIARQFSIDIFLLFKLNDDWIIDVIRGIRKAGYPVVVHDREHGITRKRMEVYPPHLKAVIDDLLVERLCVSNQTHKEFFELCGFPKDRITLTGKPDADYWRHAGPPPKRAEIDSRLRTDRKLAVFFSFGRLNYLNFFYEGEPRDWLPLSEDHHAVLLQLLGNHPHELQIAYKIGGKPARDAYPGFDAFIKEAKRIGGDDCVVVLDGNVSTLDLLRVSDLVVGFHTVGMVEASFTEQPVFYGAWGGLFEDIKETLMPLHHSRGLVFCDSAHALTEQCDRFLSDPTSWKLDEDTKAAREELQESVFFKSDGNVSERLLNVVVDVAVNFRGRREQDGLHEKE